MKIKLTFKSPDAVSYGILDAGISQRTEPDEYDELYEKLSKWVRYGEYLDVEFDTETNEMKILKK